ERDSQLEHAGPRRRGGLADAARCFEVWKAAHQVGHQGSAFAARRESGGNSLLAGDAQVGTRNARTSARSLSPRPERQIRSSSPPGFASAQASACEDSTARWRPSSTPAPAAPPPISSPPPPATNGVKMPIELEPPPTQAITREGSRSI